jgi:hypothetical protein
MKAAFSLLFTSKKLVLYSFVLLMGHCQDTYDNSKAAANLQVPPFTETGANTFGCLVNGQAWANFGGSWDKSELGFGNVVYNKVTTVLTADSGVNVVSISARLTVSTAGTITKEESMTLNIPGYNLNIIGIHQLNQVDGLFSYFSATKFTRYTSLKRNPFTVNVLKDTIGSITGNLSSTIVSGKFNGTLYNHDQTDSLRIVGGVFDVIF